MLVLKIARGPEWIALLGGRIRLLVAPMTSAVMMAVRSDLAGKPPAQGQVDEWHVALVKAIAARTILEWEGIGDADGRHRRADGPPPGLRGVRCSGRGALSGGASRKKRLVAFAEWHFGGGDEYCGACEGVCEECPRQVNRPETPEGWQIWDLVLRLGGQVRMVAGMGGAAFVGWDMAAALALAEALNVDPAMVAEILPAVEQAAMRKMNEMRG